MYGSSDELERTVQLHDGNVNAIIDAMEKSLNATWKVVPVKKKLPSKDVLGSRAGKSSGRFDLLMEEVERSPPSGPALDVWHAPPEWSAAKRAAERAAESAAALKLEIEEMEKEEELLRQGCRWADLLDPKDECDLVFEPLKRTRPRYTYRGGNRAKKRRIRKKEKEASAKRLLRVLSRPFIDHTTIDMSPMTLSDPLVAAERAARRSQVPPYLSIGQAFMDVRHLLELDERRRELQKKVRLFEDGGRVLVGGIYCRSLTCTLHAACFFDQVP